MGPGVSPIQAGLIAEATQRANAYLEAGADCVYPILLWDAEPLRQFMSEVPGPVNIVRIEQAPSVAELAALGVARVSWGPLLYWGTMAHFQQQLASIQP